MAQADQLMRRLSKASRPARPWLHVTVSPRWAKVLVAGGARLSATPDEMTASGAPSAPPGTAAPARGAETSHEGPASQTAAGDVADLRRTAEDIAHRLTANQQAIEDLRAVIERESAAREAASRHLAGLQQAVDRLTAAIQDTEGSGGAAYETGPDAPQRSPLITDTKDAAASGFRDSALAVPVPDWIAGAGPVPAAAGKPGWEADQEVTQLYSNNYRSLVHLAELLVHDRPTAEEVVQECFVAMHGGWQRLGNEDRALFYLRQAVINRSRSVLRHRMVVERNAPKPSPDMPSAEQGAISRLERSEVIAALRALPNRQRQALVLRYYADLSEAQIADLMGISRGAVKAHTARGMSSLRAVLEQRI